MKNTMIADFFKQAFNINWEEMNINEEVDVSSFNKKVLSYNNNTGKNEFNLVKKIIRKKDSIPYRVTQKDKSFICSGDHKVSFKLHKEEEEFTYMEINNIKHNCFYSMNEDKEWVKTEYQKLKGTVPILDFEVDKVHNYYSNGILSHNTMFGSPETQPGGRALKFYSSVRLDIRKKETIKKGDDSIGTMAKVKVVKNKVAPPFKETMIKIDFGKGIDGINGLIDIAVKENIIDKSGSWYSYKEEKIGQGKENVSSFLKSNEAILTEIDTKVRSIYFPKEVTDSKDIPTTEDKPKKSRTAQ